MLSIVLPATAMHQDLQEGLSSGMAAACISIVDMLLIISLLLKDNKALLKLGPLFPAEPMSLQTLSFLGPLSCWQSHKGEKFQLGCHTGGFEALL